MVSYIMCNVPSVTLGTSPSTSVNVLKSPILLERLFCDVTPNSDVIDDLINYNNYRSVLEDAPEKNAFWKTYNNHDAKCIGSNGSNDSISRRASTNGPYENGNKLDLVANSIVEEMEDSYSRGSISRSSSRRCSLSDKGIAAYRTDAQPVIVGLPCEIKIRVELNRRLVSDQDFEILPLDEEEIEVCGWDVKKGIGYSYIATVNIFPRRIGEIFLSVSKGLFEELVEVDVRGNDPLESLSAEPDWPVAVSTRPGTIFIAFPHHINEFSEYGGSTRECIRDDLFFNDIVVHPRLPLLAAGVSAWEQEDERKFRSQLLVLYNLMGEVLWTLGGEMIHFKVPVIHPAFDHEGNVFVCSRGHVAKWSRYSGKRLHRKQLTPFGVASRLTTTKQDNVLVLDGTHGSLHILDENLEVKTKFDLPNRSETDNGSCRQSWVGLAVDGAGFVYLSNISDNAVIVYTQAGHQVGYIESQSGSFLWPLSLTVSSNNYLYVVDHGHACVKKFKCHPIRPPREYTHVKGLSNKW